MSNKKKEKNNKKRLEGIVTSNKMTNAVVVTVSRQMPHPKYGKIISKRKKYYAKTENNLNIGDKVVIEESMPISKLIRWVVVERKEK
jgi:small subunit ribosomal protein S17